MTDQDPYGDPTRVDVPVTDPTQAMPAMAGGPPPGGPPQRRAEPPGEPPNHRGWILAGLFALVLLIGLAVLLLSDDGTTATDTTTTSTTIADTTSSSSSTTTAPTTTAAPTSTTTTPPATVAPSLCTSGGPTDPDKSAQVLYQAYALNDRDCAGELATADAVDELFAIPGRGGGWTYQGCTEQTDPDPHVDCAFTFAGGATHFRTNYSASKGWVVFDVYQTTD